jgi:hypothetical protein
VEITRKEPKERTEVLIAADAYDFVTLGFKQQPQTSAAEQQPAPEKREGSDSSFEMVEAASKEAFEVRGGILGEKESPKNQTTFSKKQRPTNFLAKKFLCEHFAEGKSVNRVLFLTLFLSSDSARAIFC